MTRIAPMVAEPMEAHLPIFTAQNDKPSRRKETTLRVGKIKLKVDKIVYMKWARILHSS